MFVGMVPWFALTQKGAMYGSGMLKCQPLNGHQYEIGKTKVMQFFIKWDYLKELFFILRLYLSSGFGIKMFLL